MASRVKYLSDVLNRTGQVMAESAVKMLRMSGTDPLQTTARTLYAFRTQADVSLFATGCDADLGGRSSVALTLVEDPSDPGVQTNKGRPYARFFGEMRTDVPEALKGRLRGGYAGMRNKHRPTLFGEVTEDLSLHEYLALRVRGSGDPRTRESYYVNMQTEGPVTTDLWQHRLHLRRTDGGWEDIFLPFGAFRLTNSGELVDAPVKMGREAVRSIGISLLGGNSGVEGQYDLGVDSIRVVNEQDLAGEGEREIEEEKSSGPVLGELGMPTPPNSMSLPATSVQ